jgi:type VI secretion system protein VasD
MISMHRFTCLALLAALLSLTGCAALSPYSDMTKLDLTLNGSEQLNPDLNGRPSPIVLRLIELKHPVAFETADFFSLYQRPKEALSPDMVTLN